MRIADPYASWLAPVLARTAFALEQQVAAERRLREKREQVAARSRLNRAQRRAHDRGAA